MRVDTPWTRVKSHLRYAISIVSEIPNPSRFLLLISCLFLTVAFGFRIPTEVKKKLALFALDSAMLAMVVMQND